MPEVPLEPYTLYTREAEPLFVSRFDQVFVQDRGVTFGAERYTVDRNSKLLYEREISLALPSPGSYLIDTDYVALHYQWVGPGAGARITTKMYLDGRLAGTLSGLMTTQPISGEVSSPLYTHHWDGTGQALTTYVAHPALPSASPDPLLADFSVTWVFDEQTHFFYPSYYYLSDIPSTFKVQVEAILSLPREFRSSLPSDIGPLEVTSTDHWRYPVGGGYGPPSTSALYDPIERVEWTSKRIDCLQIGTGGPPGDEDDSPPYGDPDGSDPPSDASAKRFSMVV